MVYSREFLIGAYLYRFLKWDVDPGVCVELAEKFWTEVPKQKFRDHCSLDAEACREYKEFCDSYGPVY